MDESSQDQRLPHHLNPKQFVSLDQLAGIQIISWFNVIHSLICLLILFW